MKFYAAILGLLLAFSALQAQTYSGVDRQFEFADAFPEGISDFSAYCFQISDKTPFLAFTGYSEGTPQEITATLFTVEISPDGARIVGTSATGDTTYTASTGRLVLENVMPGENGCTKYYYCCRATEYHVTVYVKEGERHFDFLKPGGYILSVRDKRG
jgi:hypothetical protein